MTIVEITESLGLDKQHFIFYNLDTNENYTQDKSVMDGNSLLS